ncbi:MAG: hypothetical protein PHU88_06790 [candidate division Zixibacteria bacterium]|nr:hypothetical protein [candidate division Zixibacteria bacterium]MDD5425703.1 hypothetical protein [candidate division Zixibacteria bacterium]
MHISPRYIAGDWKKITFQSEEDWQLAVEIFKDRIRERFLNPLEHIEKYPYAGFAVLALDCLLIEMLQQFREGVNRTPTGKSKLFFISFLTETGFKKYFDKRQAELFYRQIRCGILHQAEVRGSSRVLVSDLEPMVAYASDRRGLVVNRTFFHEQLLTEFDNYTRELLNSANRELRVKFKSKMMAICKTACDVV